MSANGATDKNKTYDFKPVHDFDPNVILPDADEGHYTAKISSVRVMATKKDNYPMPVVEMKITECHDEQDERNIDAVVSVFLAVMPGRGGNMTKARVVKLCEETGVDIDLWPKTIESKNDFNDFIAALKGRTLDIWVTHQTDKETKEVRCNVDLFPPKSAGGGELAALETEEEEEERPAKRSAAPAKKTASTKRR